ncbi:glycosyltransferase family 39 protein [filamentous cyanobacterium LEGE 11480]|uniref:Glycosyltransferase family 39 protein n=1 Tax=Romeriopsis navalis LEGE 11480 TaxID=2777977 RepID=A0A928VQK3_9CYAN|nr:glycosyltransferase family 39 protein [Romeriopsis navalis]MBE9031973.1 glycosyltransferase family 39 protein [Romeriopsis navalis LEGE 11480]
MRKLFVPPWHRLMVGELFPALEYRSVNRQLLPVWLLLGLGLGLRFANLLGKPVWLDEAFTLFHISGFQPQAAVTNLVTGLPVTVADLLQYQQPQVAHSLGQTIRNIAETAPELPPLYFALLHRWMQLFGGGVWAMRFLSAIISLAVFPTVYWLCIELFGLPIVGWYSMALIAVSPFHLNIAQEIRPYSLWSVCFLVASALFLRAQRRESWRDWVGFSGAVLVGMYTHLFMLLPWLIYWLHSLLRAKLQLTRAFKQFVVVNGFIVAGFIPWLWFGFLMPRGGREAVFAKPFDSSLGLIKGLMQGVGRFFVDFSLNETSPRWGLLLYGLCVLAVLGLAGYSLIYVARHGPRRTRSFIWLMGLLPISLFIVSDLLLNASRTSFTRYYTPSVIVIEIAIAYCMAAKQTFRFQSSAIKPRWEKRWLALLLVGTLSCGWFILMPTWWSKTKTAANLCIVETTSSAAASVIVTDEFYMRSLALAHQLKPTVAFQFYPLKSKTAPSLTPTVQSTFLYMPSPQFLKAMRGRYQLRSVCQPALWKVDAIKE